jgi:hypothetical protein
VCTSEQLASALAEAGRPGSPPYVIVACDVGMGASFANNTATNADGGSSSSSSDRPNAEPAARAPDLHPTTVQLAPRATVYLQEHPLRPTLALDFRAGLVSYEKEGGGGGNDDSGVELQHTPASQLSPPAVTIGSGGLLTIRNLTLYNSGWLAPPSSAPDLALGWASGSSIGRFTAGLWAVGSTE